MWARVIEFMLGCWLAVSPFVFHHDPAEVGLWVNDWTTATLITVFSLMSYWGRTRHLHFLNTAVALWLIGFGRLSALPPAHPEPGYQNLIVVGLLLVMFSIVPNAASQPSRAWWSNPDEAGAGDRERLPD